MRRASGGLAVHGSHSNAGRSALAFGSIGSDLRRAARACRPVAADDERIGIRLVRGTIGNTAKINPCGIPLGGHRKAIR